MDEAVLRRHLAQAEAHIAQGEEHLRKQHKIIASWKHTATTPA